jgi:hypothetical protein
MEMELALVSSTLAREQKLLAEATAAAVAAKTNTAAHKLSSSYAKHDAASAEVRGMMDKVAKVVDADNNVYVLKALLLEAKGKVEALTKTVSYLESVSAANGADTETLRKDVEFAKVDKAEAEAILRQLQAILNPKPYHPKP